MNEKKILAVVSAAMLLTGCGEKQSNAADENEMQYIKTSVLYDTIMEMYSYPDDYIGRSFHMVGTLYPSTSGDESFYSIYAKPTSGGEGIGLELEWDDFSGLEDYDTITVEGSLERRSIKQESGWTEYLVLDVTSLEKRQ